jgi:hypothetical protein
MASSGAMVWMPDLARVRPGRWTGLVVEARGLAVRAVFCFPMAVGAVNDGLLTVVRRLPAPLTCQQAGNSLMLAAELTAWYLGGGEACLQRALVHQATGMVSVRLDLPVPRGPAAARPLLQQRTFHH